MHGDQSTLAIIGCGNPTRTDDGVGPAVIRMLAERHAPGGQARLLDAGTDGMAVMFAARGCRSLILVDAVRTGSKPGTVFEVPGAELERPQPQSLNLHDFRWDHALFAGRRILGSDFPADVTVLLIEAGSIEYGVGLSPPVADAAVKVVARVAALVRARLPIAELCT
jgi:hydrogenase maturation protease